MKPPEEILKDDFLKETLGATSSICPGIEFTINVMRAVEAEATQQALLSAPLISRQVWQRLGFGIGFLLLFPFIIGFITDTNWSEFKQAVTTFALSENLTAPADKLGISTYLPKLAVISVICMIILFTDKFCQRYVSK